MSTDTLLDRELEQSSDEYYAKALATLQKALSKVNDCSAEEKQLLQQELRGLHEMSEKLSKGRVDIVVFGEINTGKSALINALMGKEVAGSNVVGGFTRNADEWSWEGFGYRIPDIDDSRVFLIDTPGINEVQGEERANIAENAAGKADLILFVADSDLNDAEYTQLQMLKHANRPLLFVFNKIDQYTREDRKRLREAFERRLQGLVEPVDVLEAAAKPMERERVRVLEDGSEKSEWFDPPSEVGTVRERALAILEKEGKALLALNASLFAADKSDRIAATKVRIRNAAAEKIIWTYAVLKGLGVAFNPIPVADVIGGTAVDVTMIVHLGRVYGIDLTGKNAKELVVSIGAVAGGMAGIEWGTHLLANVVKGLTFGLGTAVTAIPQGAAGAFGSWVVGNAAKRYFEQGASWGEAGPKRVVEEILANTDRKPMIAQLKKAIRQKLHMNRHALKK